MAQMTITSSRPGPSDAPPHKKAFKFAERWSIEFKNLTQFIKFCADESPLSIFPEAPGSSRLQIHLWEQVTIQPGNLINKLKHK